MKNACIIGLLVLLTIGCQQRAIQPADPVINTKWYGRFSYTGETISRVFTIEFSAGSDFSWQDMTGSYSGKWKRTNDDVIITFNTNGIQTSFKLVGNNQLTSPKNLNHTSWTVKQLNKIENALTQNISTMLPKTKWAGRYNLSFDEDLAGTFLMSSGTEYLIGGRGDYALSALVIRGTKAHWSASYNVEFFGVFINDKTLIGNFKYKMLSQPTSAFVTLTSEEFTKK